MKNIVYIIFTVNILIGGEKSLPPLPWHGALKETSSKDIMSSGFLSLSLGLLTYKFFQKNKPWSMVKKSLSGLAMLTPLAIVGASSIYLGKTKKQNIFKKNSWDNQTKHNIFLERLLLLAESDPPEAYNIFQKQYGEPDYKLFKKGKTDPLYNIFHRVKKDYSKYHKFFQNLVNDMIKTATYTYTDIVALYSFFKREGGNKELANILINTIKERKLDEKTIKTIINGHKEEKENIYVTAFVRFQLIQYTKVEVIEKIRTIIKDNNWTDHIDETIGKEIKALLDKHSISKAEIKNIIEETFQKNNNKKKLILDIFNSNVFAE